MPIDVTQIQNYFASSSPAALYLMQYFLPLLYLAIAVVVGVGAIRFGISIFRSGLNFLFGSYYNWHGSHLSDKGGQNSPQMKYFDEHRHTPFE